VFIKGFNSHADCFSHHSHDKQDKRNHTKIILLYIIVIILQIFNLISLFSEIFKRDKLRIIVLSHREQPVVLGAAANSSLINVYI